MKLSVYSELDRTQKLQLAQSYLTRLADEGAYAEVVGVDWSEPSYNELVNALELVPEDVLEREYGECCFTTDDFWN